MTVVFKFKSICTNMQPINIEHVCGSRIWIMAYFDRCKITISRFCFSDNKYCKYVFALSFIKKTSLIVITRITIQFSVFECNRFNNHTKLSTITAHLKIANVPKMQWNDLSLRIFIMVNGTLNLCILRKTIKYHFSHLCEFLVD